jgi:predicted AAA+ superfamily ATPase
MIGDVMEIERSSLTDKIRRSIDEMPVTVLLGARQVGKTTLARMFTAGMTKLSWYDLEVPSSAGSLSASPELTLKSLSGIVVIDEVQRLPELFSILRPLCDRSTNQCRYILLGSAAPDLIKGVSESLAGRARNIYISGFSLAEVGFENQNRLWLRGGFPRAYLAEDDERSQNWLEDFIALFLERDIRLFGLNIPPRSLRRFWLMLAHYHGQVWNGSELARAMDISHVTSRRYLDVLEGAFMVRVLQPWYENMKKRQVKSPKIYLRDSGMLHLMQGINSFADLLNHPKLGASWEGFALEQVLEKFGGNDAYFWRTQRGAELDLLLLRGSNKIGFEFKCGDAPKMTKSMHIAVDELHLKKLYVIYPGDKSYFLHDKVEVIPLQKIYSVSRK